MRHRSRRCLLSSAKMKTPQRREDPGRRLFCSAIIQQKPAALLRCLRMSPLLWRRHNAKPEFLLLFSYVSEKNWTTAVTSSGEVRKAAQKPPEVLCWLRDVSYLSCDMLHQKGHFRQLVPVPPLDAPITKHALWLWAGMDGCWAADVGVWESLPLFSGPLSQASFSPHPFHSSVWTQTQFLCRNNSFIARKHTLNEIFF